MKKYLLLLTYATWCIALPEGTVFTTGFASSFVPASPTNAENACIPTRTTQPDGRRLFSIYFPPNYDQADTQTRYPVVYWCVGFNGTVGYDNEPAQLNKEILDRFINNGQIMPMIVVYPDPSLALTFRFINSTCGQCAIGPTCAIPDFPPGFVSYGNSFYINSELNNVRYEDYFIQELIPYIDTNYNTIADRNFRAIIGQSMGGYAALLLGMRYADTFAAFAAESPTPPWMFTDPQTWPAPPAYNAFTLNSIMLAGLIDASNPNNLASPCNLGWFDGSPCAFNDLLFALAAALSPNITDSNPFVDAYKVNLPIMVDANGKAQLTNGAFDVVNFASSPSSVQTTVVDQSVVLNQSVIDIWHQNDPYFLTPDYLDSLAQQAIYIDGGDEEPINNVGSRMFSDQLMSYVIDNEYILYSGGHNTCIFTPGCSRNTTAFKMCSAQFAAAGTNAQDISCKLMGNLHITLANDAQIALYNGTILSVQTSRTIPDTINPVSNTNVTFELQDNAAIHIGTATRQGGALQIGDPLTKAQLQEYNTGPANQYASHEVAATIYLHGAGTLLEIGRQGFLGIGIGVTGKSNSYLTHSPQVANFWSVSSLANLTNMTFNFAQGTFRHNIIVSGDQEPASLFALDLSNEYIFSLDPSLFVIQGGGNMICSTPDPFADPDFVDQKVRLLHPTVLNQGNVMPNRAIPFDPAAGILNSTIFINNITDPYLNNPVSSTTAYTNYFQRGILQSTPLFDRGDVSNPFVTTTDSVNTLSDYLMNDVYEQQPIKLANISDDPQAYTVAFTQNASFIDGFTRYAFPLIERTLTQEVIAPHQQIPFGQLVKQGAIGVQIQYLPETESFTDGTITNVKELIRVYDPHTDIQAPI